MSSLSVPGSGNFTIAFLVHPCVPKGKKQSLTYLSKDSIIYTKDAQFLFYQLPIITEYAKALFVSYTVSQNHIYSISTLRLVGCVELITSLCPMGGQLLLYFFRVLELSKMYYLSTETAFQFPYVIRLQML